MPDPAQHRPSPPTRRWSRPVGGFAVAALAAVVLAGCGGGDDGPQASGGGGSTSKVDVVATTSQLGDIVRAVGGNAVDVHQILQPNTDPHEYEPRPVDVTETAKAKVVFASGLGLDGWVDDVQKQSGGEGTIVRVGDAVPTKLAGEEEGHDHAEGEEHAHEDEHAEEGHDHEHEGEFDPHWWHDPKNVEQAVGTIRDAIAKADPDAAAAVRTSAAAYLAKVRALDGAIETCIAQVPKAERKLVTSHDAFNYFAHRYGITVVGAAIPSQTTRAQPSAGEVSDLVKVIERERVKAIFPESSVNPKLAQAIAKETGATSSLTLYGDTLGAAGSDGATYLGMERHNAESVVRGFTGGAKGCAAAR
jgi:zinc/manganese transport system substrate-binding protein